MWYQATLKNTSIFIVASHYDDVIMTMLASQITSLTVVYSIVYSGVHKKNIKAPRHWPLCGKFTGDRWISRTNGQLRGKCFHLMTSSWRKGERANISRPQIVGRATAFGEPSLGNISAAVSIYVDHQDFPQYLQIWHHRHFAGLSFWTKKQATHFTSPTAI